MAAFRAPSRPSKLTLQLATVALVLGLLALLAGMRVLTGSPPDYEQACREGRPWMVAAAYRAQASRAKPPSSSAASVILFQDTPTGRPQYTLANFRQVGAVWGLAFRGREPAVYAGAFRKRALPYGPEGPGAIYRIDLATGAVTHFITVPGAGDQQRASQMADGDRTFDEDTGRYVGKTALGDLDFNLDESELYVMNLADRKIYRYAMPDGTLLGSFDHGATGEPWVDDARPFGLAIHDGYLFHGVVNSKGIGSAFLAQVYRSQPDGSEMQLVASLKLGYTRDQISMRRVRGNSRWKAWADNLDTPTGEERQLHDPQPMFTDIAFTADNRMIVGLRDRYWDMQVQWVQEELVKVVATIHIGAQPSPMPPIFNVLSEDGLGFGDILLGQPDAPDHWDIGTKPEHFDDTNALRHSESAQGGLAWIPGTGSVAGSSYGVDKAFSDIVIGDEGVYWYDVASGNKTGFEAVGQPAVLRPYADLLSTSPIAFADGPWFDIFQQSQFVRDIGSLGDLEALCTYIPDAPTLVPPTVPATTEVPPDPTETATPTDTPVLPTDTPRPPTATGIPPTATPTVTGVPPTRTPGPIYLPILLHEHCDPSRVRADVVLVLDASSSMMGTKFEAAKAAARAFIRAMRLPDDQVGLVAFNQASKIVSPLTGDRAALEAAIDTIVLERGTQIDTGLEDALAVLAGPERIAAHTPVVVLMTDGIQVGDPERPQTLAGDLRRGGVDLHVVGLGVDLDTAYLARLAGEPGRLYLSPSPETLASIYEQIARVIPCPAEAYWGGR